MATKRTRRFGLLDGMILVAATAIGMYGASLKLGRPPEALSVGTFLDWVLMASTTLEAYATDYVVPFLFAWSCAAIVLCLRHPRPNFRRLASSPGFLSICVAVTFVLFHFVTIAVFRLKYSWATFEAVSGSLIAEILTVGWALLPVIVLLWLRRRRSKSGWAERLALILGLAWVGVSLLSISLSTLGALASLKEPIPVY